MSLPRASRSNQVLFDSAVLDSILPFLHDRNLLSLGLVCRSFNVYLRYSKGAELTEARWRCERNRKQTDGHPRIMRRPSSDGDGESCPSPAWSRAVSAVGVVVHSGSSLGIVQRPAPSLRMSRSVSEDPEPKNEGIWDSLRNWFTGRRKPAESAQPTETRRGRSRDTSRNSQSGDESEGSKSRDSSPSLEAPWWRLEQHQVDDWKDTLGGASGGSGSQPSTPTALSRRASTKKETPQLSTKQLDSLYRKKLQRDDSKGLARRADSPLMSRRELPKSQANQSTPITISKNLSSSSLASSPSSLKQSSFFPAPQLGSSITSSSPIPTTVNNKHNPGSATPSPTSSPPSSVPTNSNLSTSLMMPFPFVTASSSSSSSLTTSTTTTNTTTNPAVVIPSSLSTSSSSLSLDSPVRSSSFPSFESIEDAEAKATETTDRKELVQLPDDSGRDLTFWNEIVLDRWSIVRDSPLVIKIWDRDGVPPSMRGVVWAMAIGNVAEVASDAYLVVRHQIEEHEQQLEPVEETREVAAATPATELPAGWVKTPSSAPAPSPARAPAPEGLAPARSGGRARVLSPRHSFGVSRTDSIEADLLRMFPKMKQSWMQKTGSLWCNLRELLQAFCYYRPDVSYIQGMSYLAAVFLVYMPPERAFVCLVNLIRRDYFPSYMQMDALNIRARFQVFEAVFEANLPALFQKFAQVNLLPDCYLMEWLLTLFSKQLPLDIVSRIWDNYLLYGEVYVFKVACGLLTLLQARLIEKNANECMRVLRGAFPDFTERQVLSATSQVLIPLAVNAFYERRKVNPDYCEFDPIVIHTPAETTQN